jgi:DnaK suppressor protein
MTVLCQLILPMNTKATKIQFTQKFLDDTKTLLLAEKARLENELGQFTKKNDKVDGDYNATFPEYGEQSDENAHEVADYLANKPLEMTMEKMLRDVNVALKRIDDGTYGVCKYCDNPIDEKRLLARPTSSACISCKKTLTQEV